ncbi:NAD-dependent epimerase/dehydratase family protein [Pedobacter sp. AW1-32]|uniref:NAD-dependent epimerase/dehydratase family protein n=1 Tax=Pedobacter sp. AW1-32 TaxID=3383026 RepID=UPI003FEF2801
MGSIEKILVTGATGFLGSKILQNLLTIGYNPVILVRTTSNLWRIKNIISQCEVFTIEENGGNIKDLFELYNVTSIIHTATEYGRDKPLSTLLRTNVIFPIQLIEYGLKKELKLFINADTFFAKPQFEQDYLNQYTDSKRILEKLLKGLSRLLAVRNVRLEHIFGENDADSKFFTAIFNQLVRNEPEILLTDGYQKRDFVYVDDAAEAFVNILQKTNNEKGYIEFQTGLGKSVSVRDLVEEMAKLTGSKSVLKFGALQNRVGEIPDSFADLSELTKTGWKAKYDLSSAIIKMIKLTK